MFRIVFKKLKSSDITRKFVQGRLEYLAAKFPVLRREDVQVTVSMENSPLQPGKDVFGVKLQILRGYFRGVRLEKKSSHLYVALAHLIEDSLETLNRFTDRKRVQGRTEQRKLKKRSLKLLSIDVNPL